jgi:hypothetical protein
MLSAIVLVCSLAVTPDLRECGRKNAVHVLQVPEEFALPAMCAMRGRSSLAETSGQSLPDNERVKVMWCDTCPQGARSGERGT